MGKPNSKEQQLDPSSTVVGDCGKRSSYFSRTYERFVRRFAKM